MSDAVMKKRRLFVATLVLIGFHSPRVFAANGIGADIGVKAATTIRDAVVRTADKAFVLFPLSLFGGLMAYKLVSRAIDKSFGYAPDGSAAAKGESAIVAQSSGAWFSHDPEVINRMDLARDAKRSILRFGVKLARSLDAKL